MEHPEEYPKAAMSATVCVYHQPTKNFLLIRRGRDPFKGELAFPGGFLDAYKENIYQTAVRELREETGMSIVVGYLTLLDIRSNPDRDPRDHVIDVGFLVIDDGPLDNIKADDDADEIVWVDKGRIGHTPLAFDHKLILAAAKVKMALMGC